MDKQISFINELFETLQQQTADVQYAALIRAWMSRSKVIFDELDFTQAKFRAEEQRAAIGYIEGLFETLKQLQGDLRYVGHIRAWMCHHKIRFAKLNFTKEELKAEKQRAAIGYIEGLFVSLKRPTSGVQYANDIRSLMRSHRIPFAWLNFTRKELGAEEKKFIEV